MSSSNKPIKIKIKKEDLPKERSGVKQSKVFRIRNRDVRPRKHKRSDEKV